MLQIFQFGINPVSQTLIQILTKKDHVIDGYFDTYFPIIYPFLDKIDTFSKNSF